MADAHDGSSTPARPGVLERAILVLRTAVEADEPLGVRELARSTGIARSTVARLLDQLEDLDLVARDSDARVLPGLGLASLQPGRGATTALVARLRPVLVELVEQFGESAAVALDDGESLLYLAYEHSNSAVQVASVEQERHPFHLVAPGICIMSTWPAERLAAYLAAGLASPTAASVINPIAIEARLERVRSDGYAWATEELDVDVNGVATLVPNPGGAAVAVGLYGPSFRLSPTTSPTVGAELAAIVASRLSTGP